MKPRTQNSDWAGVCMIATTALACCICISVSIVAYEHAKFYMNAPYRLEGGSAFATNSGINFFCLFNLLIGVSAFITYIVYCLVRTSKGITPHIVISGVFLPPCLIFVGLYVRGLLD